MSDPLVDLVDDARLAAAVAERSRGRLLADADAAEATLRSTLRTLAEQGAVVVAGTTTGDTLRGRVVAVAGDHVVLRGDHGTAWVAVAALTTVRVRPGVRMRATEPDGRDVAQLPLPEALRALHEVRAEVHVLLPGADAVRGRLVAVGRDVASLAAAVGGDHTVIATDRVVAVTTQDA